MGIMELYVKWAGGVLWFRSLDELRAFDPERRGQPKGGWGGVVYWEPTQATLGEWREMHLNHSTEDPEKLVEQFGVPWTRAHVLWRLMSGVGSAVPEEDMSEELLRCRKEYRKFLLAHQE